MFNPFIKNKPAIASNTAVAVAPSKYSKEIEEVHHEFETAAEKLYNEAVMILTANKVENKEKIERLKSLGFCAVKEVVEVVEREKAAQMSQETIDLIREYRVKYPMNKFITLQQVEQICEKYGLVHGEIGLFRGFVPEKNLGDIEKFQKIYKTEQMAVVVPYSSHHNQTHRIISIKEAVIIPPDEKSRFGYLKMNSSELRIDMQQKLNDWDGRSFYGPIVIDGEHMDARLSAITLQIAGPQKDFDMSGMTVKKFQIVKEVPDPVVLQPVKGGFLIVTAWGDEASDPLVVNELSN